MLKELGIRILNLILMTSAGMIEVATVNLQMSTSKSLEPVSETTGILPFY
jgi:hypothetical protein